MDKLILCDVDGVVLNYNSAFEKWMSKSGIDVILHDEYDFTKKYGISNDMVHSYCQDFTSSLNIQNLEFIEDSFKYINKLYEQKGYKFHFITSISKEPPAVWARTKNLLQQISLDAIHEVTCLGFLEDKYQYLYDNYNGSNNWWIEDSVPNFISGEKVGLRSLLIDHPYNRDYNTPNRVTSWKEIYDRINSDE